MFADQKIVVVILLHIEKEYDNFTKNSQAILNKINFFASIVLSTILSIYLYFFVVKSSQNFPS